MAATPRAPKQWCLTKTETVTSGFEFWRQNLVYTLSSDAQFALFLLDGATWSKKTKENPLRCFTDDGSSVPEASRRTAQQKVSMLELMLGQIPSYCPVISRTPSSRTQHLWAPFGQLYACISASKPPEDISLIFSEIHLEHGERPEDLYRFYRG